MTLASPMWLLALLPWAALVAWMFSGQNQTTAVPFVHLWRGPIALPKTNRAVRRPPPAIILILLAMLLAILAAGRPKVASKIKLKPATDLADDQVVTHKQFSWPLVQARGNLSPEVERIIQSYLKLRPPNERSVHVEVSDGSEPIDAAAVIVAGDVKNKVGGGSLHIEDHPIAANVNWNDVIQNVSAAKTQAGWKPVVMIGNEVLVAVRESPARQVWIGFDSPDWPRTSDFVIFWSNVLDWVGQRGEDYTLQSPPKNDSQKLQSSPIENAGIELSSPLLLGALCLILAAAVVSASCKNCAAG
jgi:hypothetical protein